MRNSAIYQWEWSQKISELQSWEELQILYKITYPFILQMRKPKPIEATWLALGYIKGSVVKSLNPNNFFFFFCCDPIATGIERVNEPFEWWCTNFHPEFMERDMLLHPPTTLLFLIFEKQSGRIWWDLSEWWLSSVTFILMHIFVGFVQKNFIWIHKSVHKCV